MTVNSTADEFWDHGTVQAGIFHSRGVAIAAVEPFLPDSDLDFDPVELDWQAFTNDLDRRFGPVGDPGEPEWDNEVRMWIFHFPLPSLMAL
jgi:hypothetical protein